MEDTKHNEEIHVLLVAFSAQGHINPMLRLGKSLITKNVHVTLATTEFARHRMLQSSTITTTTAAMSGINLLFFSDGLSIDYDRKADLDLYLEILGKHGPIHLSNIIKDKKFSCVVSNPFVPWVVDVANDFKIPCAMLWIQPCSIYAIYYRFYNKLNEFPSLTQPELSVDLPGLPLLLPQDLPSFVLPSNPMNIISNLFCDMFMNMKKYTWVIGNSFYELEMDAIESMNNLLPIRTVGPLVPPSLLSGETEVDDIDLGMWKSDDECIEWLDKQLPCTVIYVSFGSILELSGEKMEAIAIALKNSKRPFIWVIREQDLPSWFIEETKDQGLVVSWSPQTKVLSHVATSCFLTHCGWNSLLETIVAGVPVIAYPQWTDQPLNAKLITDEFRVGLRVNVDQDGVVTSEEIEKCITEIMDGPKSENIRFNASSLKKQAKEAVASGGSSDRNIGWFIDEIISRQKLTEVGGGEGGGS